jgi:hypothetical protein
VTTFLDAKANKPPTLTSIGALLAEPKESRIAIADKLRAVAREIADMDPARSWGLHDAADIIEHGRAMPQGVA